MANDNTIVYNKRVFQLHAQQPTIISPKDKITVNVMLNRSIKLTIRKTTLLFEEINARTNKSSKEKIVKEYKGQKPSENSRCWASGLLSLSSKTPSQESRLMKLAQPAIEAS